MSEGQTATRALVIDYTPAIVQFVCDVLRTMNGIGHCDSTSKGDTAADLLDRNEYDVVILEALVPYGEERLLGYRTHPLPRRRDGNRPHFLRRSSGIMSEHGKRSETLGISHSVESNAKCFFLSLSW